MKNILRLVFGALLVALGVIYALNVFGLTNVNVSLDGWWAFFIIIPCLEGLFNKRDKVKNLTGVIIGVLLLLAARDVFDYEIIFKLIVPIVIVMIGIKVICNATKEDEKTKKGNNEELVAFSSKKINYDGEITLCKIGAVFGGASCNLKDAKVIDGAQIQVLCAFGGADIIVPDDVNVKINGLCIFGGISDKRYIKEHRDNAATLNINGFCIFGGADIK